MNNYSENISTDALMENLTEIVTIENSAHFSPWSLANFKEAIKAKNTFKVFSENGKIFGYYIVIISLDQCELLNITIAKEMQNLGKGSLLINNLFSLCKTRHVLNIFLEVRASNEAAIKLYEKNGFNELGVRSNYYKTESGREDGLLMGFTFD